MQFSPRTCESCGANLPTVSDRDSIVCLYCRTEHFRVPSSVIAGPSEQSGESTTRLAAELALVRLQQELANVRKRLAETWQVPVVPDMSRPTTLNVKTGLRGDWSRLVALAAQSLDSSAAEAEAKNRAWAHLCWRTYDYAVKQYELHKHDVDKLHERRRDLEGQIEANRAFLPR